MTGAQPAPEPNKTVDRFLNGEIEPHDLPWKAWQVWSEGFRAGSARATARLQTQIDRANRDADVFYMEARHKPEEVRQMRLDAMDDGWRAYWDAGMPTEVPND